MCRVSLKGWGEGEGGGGGGWVDILPNQLPLDMVPLCTLEIYWIFIYC